AFISTSLVNLVIAFIAHLFGLLRGYDNNVIDGFLFRTFRKLPFLRVGQKRKDFWRPIVERLIFLLSDYQLLFGVAILIAGLWKHCSISVYHFALVIDLAWFSNTHMTSLSILKCYLRERPTLRNWRVYIMIVMLIMMLVALVLASSNSWGVGLSCPAQCLFSEPGRNFQITGPYMFALVLHYSTAIWRVFDTAVIDRFILHYPTQTLRSITQPLKRTDSGLTGSSTNRLRMATTSISLLQWVVACFILIYLILAAILGSLSVSLYYDIIWFSLGLVSILWTRDIVEGNMDGNENQLSFGQIVPILLCSSILLTFKEVYIEQLIKTGIRSEERSDLTERQPSSNNAIPPESNLKRSCEDLEMGFKAIGVSSQAANDTKTLSLPKTHKRSKSLV
ncbi:MAG: hypothetical protein Q9214_001964, partial [Letrouitia sp. 1 TL-2023]